jgi:hypothetical protein
MRLVGILVCTLIVWLLCAGFSVPEHIAHAVGMGSGLASLLLFLAIAFGLHKVSS